MRTGRSACTLWPDRRRGVGGPPWAGRERCGVARCGRGGDGRRPGVASSPTGLRPG